MSGSAGDAVLLGFARLALDPINPDRDARQATMYLDRLIAEYPHSAVMAEALTWKSLIQASERLQRDVRRYQHEVERLSRDLRREQQETAKLREERERLRQIAWNLSGPGSCKARLHRGHPRCGCPSDKTDDRAGARRRGRRPRGGRRSEPRWRRTVTASRPTLPRVYSPRGPRHDSVV
jgi:hypothetical protein